MLNLKIKNISSCKIDQLSIGEVFRIKGDDTIYLLCEDTNGKKWMLDLSNKVGNLYPLSDYSVVIVDATLLV